jgi:hypothetical protein
VYQLVELPGMRFFRNELQGPISESQLRKDTGKIPPRDRMDKLEQDALEREDDDDDMATQPPDGAAVKDASQRFVGSLLRKEFIDVGFIDGRVIAHIPPNSGAGKDENLYDGDDSNDVDNDQGMFGERFLVEYSNGVRERLRPEALLDLIVADDADGDGDGEQESKLEDEDNQQESKQAEPEQPKKAKQKKKAQHKWMGARVKSFTTNDTGKETIVGYGRIIQVIKQKGKSNRYRVEWGEDTGFDPETYSEGTIKKILVAAANV